MTDDETSEAWAPPSGPAQQPGPWKVIRARRDRGTLDMNDGWVGGVCAGLATSIGADVLLVRLAFLLAGAGGFGLLAYVGLWLFTPRAGEGGTPDPWPAPKSMADTIKIALFVSAVVGVLGGVRVVRPLGFYDAGTWIGLVLVAGGAFWLIRRRDGQVGASSGTDQHAAAGTFPSPPPGSSAAGASWHQPAAPSSSGAAAGSGSPFEAPSPTATPQTPAAGIDAVASAGGDDDSHTMASPIDATLGLRPPADRPPAVSVARGASDGGPGEPAGRWGLGPAVLTWIGVLAAIGLQLVVAAFVLFEAVDVPAYGLLAAVGTTGLLVMIVAAGRRRSAMLYGAGGGIIVAALVAGIVWGSFNGPVGSRSYLVRDVDDLRPSYEIALGELRLDLADVDLSGGDQAVDVTMGVGRIDVIVPDDVDVVIDYDAQLAAIQWGRESREGWDLSGNVELPADDDAVGTLSVTADIGAGDVYVCRWADADRAAGHCQGF